MYMYILAYIYMYLCVCVWVHAEQAAKKRALKCVWSAGGVGDPSGAYSSIWKVKAVGIKFEKYIGFWVNDMESSRSACIRDYENCKMYNYTIQALFWYIRDIDINSAHALILI